MPTDELKSELRCWVSLNNRRGDYFILRRPFLLFALLALIAINIAMAAVGVARHPAFFGHPGARALVLELICVLLAYAVVVLFLARTHGRYWNSILRAAMIFGILTGAFEAVNIGIENDIPLAVHSPVLPIGFMLVMFTTWGIAGFRSACSLRSIRAGLLAAGFSAGICMLIGVAVGFSVELFLAPPEPTYVSTWAEFRRSGWADPRAFGAANTLDSGLTHLVVAPIVGLFFGALASLLAQLRPPRTGTISA